MPSYDADWYAEAMTSEGARALEPLERSPWLQLYEEATKLIPVNAEVIDLGCGTGRFIELLFRNKHYGKVTGVDFSEQVLEAARRYTRGRPVEYQLCDLNNWRQPETFAGNTVFVCLEVLEHLEYDLDLIGRIPPEHRLIFSVPNFDSASHVRWFHGVGDVWHRYERLLTFESWRLLRHGEKATHLVEARLKSDSW